MNLMIVDDEKLTRDGLEKGIDWAGLGITHVITAADGMEALQLCRGFTPDILLTDIRMPRLDGIALCERLQTRFPRMITLFMSGYSDREYLKAAIRLKAVEYVEKPIEIDTVRAAVAEAMRTWQQRLESEEYRSYSRRQEEAALALALTHPGWTGQLLKDPKTDAMPVFAEAYTMLLQCYTLPHDPRLDDDAVCALATGPLAGMHIHVLFTPHRIDGYVFHLICSHSMTEERIRSLGQQCADALSEAGLAFHLSFGRRVHAAEDLYRSYNDAVIGMQNAFFRPINTCVFYEKTSGAPSFFDLSDPSRDTAFRQLLLEEQEAPLTQFADTLLTDLLHTPALPGQIRDLYYRLFTLLADAAAARHLDPWAGPTRPQSWDNITAGNTIFDLHDTLCSQIVSYCKAASESDAQPSAVSLIKAYIAAHFGDSSLSINDISEHVHLSSSYVCTLFRTQTGSTLNQYITEYRMEQARRMLQDPRNRVQEVAERVGFSDGNYFSKAFRKAFGVSPSEFRGKQS